MLLSEDFAAKLEVEVGDQLIFVGSTSQGGIAFYNFVMSGTVRFGIAILDRGAIIVVFTINHIPDIIN